MDLDEIIAQEIEGVHARLRQRCKPGAHFIVFIQAVDSPSDPLTDAEWDIIFSAEDWKPNHREALERIRRDGSYNICGREISGFWLGEYVVINDRLKKHRLPYRLKSHKGVIRMARV